MPSYRKRQTSVMVPADLVRDLWIAIKAARDESMHQKMAATAREAVCNDLLRRMKDAGMTAHLPTLEEAQAAWRGEE